MSSEIGPLLLLILDGWGYSEDPDHNAILNARKPVWDKLWEGCPHTLIWGSGTEVGLPADQMGNSEVGHLNLGAGRVVFQEATRLSNAIRTGSFFDNETLTGAVRQARDQGKAVHILGLLSDGGVHSHHEYIHAMVELAARQGAERIYLHAFLDGRDSPPKSALSYIERMEVEFRRIGKGRFASVIGRYYALDRDHRWDRVAQAWELIASGKAHHQTNSATAAVEQAYQRGETDEFIQSTAICPDGSEPVRVEDGDVMIFMNYRADRARQITRSFIDDNFAGFLRERVPKLGSFVSLTEYNRKFDVPVAFPPQQLHNVFGEFISDKGYRQLRIAETEKYAHVTFFLNGGLEPPFPGEDRILVRSPKVATYDEQPEMSAPEVTSRLVEAINSGNYDFIICNYANPDMVGHTGNYPATVAAIEALDSCLGEVLEATRQAGGEILITADHGNAEQMTNTQTGQAHTAHTLNPVPFIYVGRPATVTESGKGALSDVAPTLLYLKGIKPPPEMDGESLVQLL